MAAPHVGRFVAEKLVRCTVKKQFIGKISSEKVAGKITGYTKRGINQAISRNDGRGIGIRMGLGLFK